MNTVEKECKGTIRVAQDVVSEVAAAAAEEIDGVICGPKNVTVKYTGGAAEVSLAVLLKAGTKAQSVSETVQNAVRDSIQSMTGVTVSRVNIKICGQI